MKTHRANPRRCPLFIICLMSTSVLAQWPQWGGPNRDFKSDAKGLAAKWPDDGPKRVWSRPLGDGLSSIAMDDGKLFTMYRDGEEEVVIAIDASTGKTVWQNRYAAVVPSGVETRFGVGPRSTPTIAGDRVYTLGIAGMLQCTRKKDGKTVWSHDLIKAFGAKSPEFGFASSSTVYQGKLIVAGGGKGNGIMAFDLVSGSVVWRKHDFENVYSSPVVINVDGQDQIVLLVDRELVAVNPDNGNLLWRRDHANQWKTNISTPVWGSDGLLYTTSGGDAGSRVLKLARKDGKTDPKEVWAHRKASVGQGNVVRVGNHFYGCAGYGPNSFLAVVHAETGEMAWRERGFAKGMIVYGDGKLIVLDEGGTLTLVKASPKSFEVLSSFKLFDLGEEKNSWTLPILVGKRLYARDNDTIVALDLG
ncbi:MAG: PQQ-binding-like beta-propeller repeat protein [Planctomycetes bacterium]|nr:PQQ-binding-like beta-propeller repeat protein [Planctomycetota bacterium]